MGCGGGDHLYNLHKLDSNLHLYGADRSDGQLNLFKARHPTLFSFLNPFVKDLTEAKLHLPPVELIFTQAVLMHISEKDNRFYKSLSNLFTKDNSYLVLTENWTQHNFLEASQRIIKESKDWSNAKIYFTESDIDQNIKCMVISKIKLDLPILIDYEYMLNGRKVVNH